VIKPWALLTLAVFAAPLGAAEAGAPQAQSPAAEVEAAPQAVPETTGPKENGFTYCIGVTALSVFNGSPLSYTPFELGWRFDNGLRLRGGVDIFYYEGIDKDDKLPLMGNQLYSYDMMDLRLSLLYAVPLPGRVRPLAGVTVEAVRGTRKLAGGVLNPPTQDAWGFLGTGAVLGGEWRVSESLAIELLARYTFSYNDIGALTGIGLGTAFLF